jgi:hypothetical protein
MRVGVSDTDNTPPSPGALAMEVFRHYLYKMAKINDDVLIA